MADAMKTNGIPSFSDIWQMIKKEIKSFGELFATKKKERNSNAKLHSSDLPPSFFMEVENFWEFLQILPWREYWMIGIITFHVFCFLFIITTRKHVNVQYIFFFVLLVTVYCSESINTWAAKNYNKFSKENYFDSNGLFLSTVFSGPILINCLLLICIWLTSTARQLITVKRQQISNAGNKKREKESVDNETKKTK